MNTLHLLAAAVLPAALATGQCAFTNASISQMGAGCNPVVGTTTAPLTVNVQFAACEVGIHTPTLLDPNKDPIGRVLVLGLSAGAVPVPALGPGCVLYPSADVVLFDPIFSSAHVLQLPSTPLPPTTVYAQGAVLYRLLPTNTIEWGVSVGMRIDLQ